MRRMLILDGPERALEGLRGELARAGLHVVGEPASAHELLRLTRALRPQLVAVSASHPEAGEATRLVMQHAATPVVWIGPQSQGEDRGAGLEAGAIAVLDLGAPGNGAALARRLESLSRLKVVRRWGHGTAPAARPSGPEVLAIGASTGGPAAVSTLLRELPRDLPLAVLVAQHMSRGFSSSFVEWLQHSSALPVQLAADGERVVAGRVYVSNDEHHLELDDLRRTRLIVPGSKQEFRPSVNRLFHSVARVCGRGTVAVLLTGMGSDGAEGMRLVRQCGGFTLAQDESTSVVFGMAREAVRQGGVDRLLPLQEIVPAIVMHLQKTPGGASP